MHTKIITFLLIFGALFSLRGLSQTTEKSDHPLLDKYYPQPQKTDTNKTITNQIKSVSQIKSAPSVSNITTPSTKPVVTTTIIPADTTSITPAATTTAVSSVTTTSAITTTNADVTTIPHLTRPPVQVKVQPQRAPGHPYIDTRLGSSTPQYDTWEKNNNGAGSVTTSPK
jgi:hypothetical protein